MTRYIKMLERVSLYMLERGSLYMLVLVSIYMVERVRLSGMSGLPQFRVGSKVTGHISKLDWKLLIDRASNGKSKTSQKLLMDHSIIPAGSLPFSCSPIHCGSLLLFLHIHGGTSFMYMDYEFG